MTAFAPALNSSRIFVYALACAVFAILFLFHIYPIGLGDLYWHLNTGRWIWEHGALPVSDPFTYTINETPDPGTGLVPQSDWQHLTLQGYWLAQLLFYFVYATFGMWGLIVLKALLFVTLYCLVWRTLLKARVEPLLGLLAILILPWLLYRFDELRPHIFSFIGVVLVYMCMGGALAQLRQGVARPHALFALPFIMLLWANLHPGFMLGWIIIVTMLAGALVDRWRGVNVLERPALRRLFIWGSAALLASMVNPSTEVFITYMGVVRSQFAFEVDEFLPLYKYARMFHQPFLFYGVLILVLVTLSALVRRLKHIDPAHAFLFLGFTAAGFYAFRYMIFSVVMVLAIGMPHISAILERYIERARLLLIALVFVAMSGVGYLVFLHGPWKQGPVETAYVPERAADWILSQHPPGPLFNAYEYGGYLGWRLAPDYKVFVDPRCLDFAVQNDYQTARGGHYQGVFEKYGVNSVVFYIRTPVIRSIPEVALYMLMDQQWDLVYVDSISVVMVRHERNTMPVIDKAPLLNYMRQVLERTLATTPEDTQALVQYGRVLQYRGNIAGARQHFNTALKINPRIRAARFYLEELNRQNK